MLASATLLAAASSCIVVAISDILIREFGSGMLGTRLTIDGLPRLSKSIDFLLEERIECPPGFCLKEE
jgi:hypothetical protein